MSEKKYYIIYDMIEKKKYSPMNQRQASMMIGCSRTSIYLAATNYTLIFGRWHAVELQSAGTQELFPEAWDDARYRILNLCKN